MTREGVRNEPVFLGSRDPFPDPRRATADGLVAVGADLSVDRLLAAYDAGIFPWYDEGIPPLWWCPDPRGVFEPAGLRVSHRLERRLRAGGFELRWNTAFGDVIRQCGRGRSDGTWIIPEMEQAYLHLHDAGHAHSAEVWSDGELIGGLYGVQRGGLFAAESKFHRRRDASKIALVAAIRSLFRAGISLFDVQFVTPHLARLGAVSWSRERYLERLSAARATPVDLSAIELDWRA